MPGDTEISTTGLMNVAVAEDHLSTIRAHLNGARSTLHMARELIELLDRGQGWRALGYRSLVKCLQDRLGLSRTHSYRLVGTAKVINSSPKGDADITAKPPVPLELNERAKRELLRLPTDQHAGAMAIVTQRASADSTRRPRASAKLVGAVVAEIIEESAKGDPVESALLRAEVFVGLVNDLRSIRTRIVNVAGAPEGGYLDMQACAADLNNVMRTLNFSMPFRGCPACEAKGCKMCKQRGWISAGLFKALEKGTKK